MEVGKPLEEEEAADGFVASRQPRRRMVAANGGARGHAGTSGGWFTVQHNIRAVCVGGA